MERNLLKLSPSSPNYQRVKYFNSLRSLQPASAVRASTFLCPPAHLLDPAALVIPNYDPARKVSSWRTVFALWNTMVGSSLLTLPWAFAHSGLALGLCIALVCGAAL